MRQIGLILFFSFCASAQIGSDGIVASVTRSVNIAPDEAAFTVVVGTALDTTSQQVTQTLTEAGISNSLIVAVMAGQTNYGYPPDTSTQAYYQVTFNSSPSTLTAIAKKLDALRAALPAGIVSLQYV